MFIGFCIFILLAILGFVGANTKSKNTCTVVFILGFIICVTIGIINSSWLIFGIMILIWAIICGASMNGVNKAKANMYLANKYDESNK